MRQPVIYISSPSPKFNEHGESIGFHNIKMLGKIELENFISIQLFPPEIIPMGVRGYLNQKHLKVIKYISDFVFTHVPNSKESPADISQVKNAIKMSLLEANININELRKFDENEVRNWKIAKSNGELEPFGGRKR